MTKDQLKSFVRTQIEDIDSQNYQLSDTNFNIFLKEAEREAFERAKLGRINQNITLVVDQASYDLPFEIIELIRVKISGEARPLVKTTQRELDFEISSWDAQPSSTPKYYYQVNDTITLYPTPDAVGTLLLDGYRYAEYELETPENLHESLGYWIMYRLYSIPDVDTSDAGKALLFESKFSDIFGHKKKQEFIETWRNGQPYSSMMAHPFN